jgi:uncharacterized OB-fold protein
VILPAPTPATEPYWQGAREGRLLLPWCEACRRWFHPRQPACACGRALAWRAASGRGTLVAHAVIRHPFNPAVKDQVPYTLTVTRLEEGPQLLTSLPGEGHGLSCGAAMQVTFDAVTPDVTLPRFAPSAGAAPVR